MMTLPRRLPLLLLVLLVLSGAIQAQETTEEPIATLTPTATATVEATSTPFPSHTPSLEPSATTAPTNTSTMEPTITPLLTEEITEAPTATVTPVATEEATAEVTLEPTAEITAEATTEVTIEPTAEVTAEPPVVTPQKQRSRQQSQPQAAMMFVVNSIADPGDGTCDATECTLREAITAANANSGTDTIAFDIPGAGPHTIQPITQLPAMTDAVIIDGTTEPDYAGAPVIELDGQSTILIGLTLQASNSIIRGLAVNRFDQSGIVIENADANTIEVNYIGIAPDGETAVGNLSYGLRLANSDGTTIQGNVISGNLDTGVLIDVNSPNTVIQGNRVGTNAAGTIAVGNGTGTGEEMSGGGIVSGGLNTLVGGEIPAERNIISGNQGDGLEISGSNSTIQGNYIGTDVTGTIAIGNTYRGLVVTNEGVSAIDNVLVGGASPADRNIISGNGSGIVLNNSGVVTVQNNYIGTDVSGMNALGNQYSGIVFVGSNATITGNIIAYNFFNGVEGYDGVDNRITANSIFANELVGDPPENWPDIPSGLGIDLTAASEGATPNDPGDTDTGPNNLQNFPELTSAVVGGGDVTLTGTLNSTANTQFRIEFFANAACDPSGYGEGETYLGFTGATTDGSGNVIFNALMPVTASANQFITATAIDPNGNTSEFSACVEVEENAAQTYVVNSTADPGDGTCDATECTLREAITAANANSGTDTIAFDIPGAGPHTIQPITQLPAMTDAVIIDGTTEPDYVDIPIVVLSGISLVDATDVHGLHISAGNSIVRGLVINQFSDNAGISLTTNGGNIIEGNYIGVAADGTTPQGNLIGIEIKDSPNNLIGGSTVSARNVIANNLDLSLQILGNASTGNDVQGNYIGVDIVGHAELRNNESVYLLNSSATTFGTNGDGQNDAAEGNVILGAIHAENSSNNVFAGNMLGTDPTGTIHQMDESMGVHLGSGSSNNRIGTNGDLVSDDIEANVIGGHTSGVHLSGATTTNNLIAGNYIGTDVSGTIDLDVEWGIVIELGANNNTISSNVMRYSYVGIVVDSGTGNRITANSIAYQSLMTLDLSSDWSSDASVTANDPGDSDTGPNNFQNYPVLTGASINNSEIALTGMLNSTSNTQFRIEYFANNDCHATGHGGGEFYLGFSEVTTDGSGDAVIAHVLDVGYVNVGQFITTTATDPNGNTSEFSACIEVEEATAQTYVVNSIADPGDGTCDSTECTLREAINAANDNPGKDTIAFDIPGAGPHTIQPLTQLPVITDAIIIDGTTEPDYAGAPVVELDGQNMVSGIALHVGNSVIRGLAINRFYDGLSIYGVGPHTIEENYIGIAPDGETAAGNYLGIVVDAENSYSTIRSNVISGNLAVGLLVSEDTSDVTIEGNLVGTDASGTAIVENGAVADFEIMSAGLDVSGSNVTIGGETEASRNIISGNHVNGIVVRLLADNVAIKGNYIGTDITGMVDLGNESNGIYLDHVSNITVSDNLISGNDAAGVYGSNVDRLTITENDIGINSAGDAALPNGSDGVLLEDFPTNGIYTTTSITRNAISGNIGNGVRVVNGSYAYISGNFIGIDWVYTPAGDGTTVIPNQLAGVRIETSSINDIYGNTISGNAGSGIEVVDSDKTSIGWNYIGTEVYGRSAVPNQLGVSLVNSSNTVISGHNIISGNRGDGIRISGAGSYNNRIEDNYIGLDNPGTGTIPNLGNGISIISVSGETEVNWNTISGNLHGVAISSSAENVTIQGNRIGTDATGMLDLGNKSTGVYLEDVSNITVMHNVISGNDIGGGILSLNVDTLTITGNSIGTDLSGTAAISNLVGIPLSYTTNAVIQDNLISGNADTGVIIDEYSS
ncbi:MAG: right-handed parallel beta-helix repeat-containing protein, partial [Anaerolineae bacterium]|nr:right-handed parallel beta-helix repeat-containing protein [Anaerolineae bacterium]